MSPPYPVLNNRPIDQWKVAELKEELKKRKLITRGLKEDLINRLCDSINEELDALKQQELANGLGQKPDQEEVLIDPMDGEPIEESKTEPIEESKAEPIEESKTEPIEESKAEPIEESKTEPIEASKTGSQSVDFVTDSTIAGNVEDKTTSTEAVEAPDLSAAAITDSNVAVGEVCATVVMVSGVVESNSFQLGVVTSGQDSLPDEKCGSNEKGMDYKSMEINNKENDEKDEGLKPLAKDVNLHESEPNDQVSEVKPDLGFPVNCESNSIVPINEKNELKDNLNADNFHLELEVVKPEILHSSFSDVAPVGDDFHSLDKVQEPSENQLPLEKSEDVASASYEDLDKKNDGVGGGDPEKLNLDRSSGDESMEEDVSESKQIDSNSNLEVVQDRIDVEEVNVEDPSKAIGESVMFPTKKDAVAEEENKHLFSVEKRKLEEKEQLGSNESSKRQRRWGIETPKVPEQEISTFTSSITQAGLGQSTPRRTIARSDSNISGDAQKERIVPPSQKPPTNSLRIDRFLRPFTLKAVQELLAKTGSVCSFWMDNIKTHCYVTYSSEEEAIQTRNAVYNLQWPPNGGRLLLAEFVDPQDVKNRVEAPPESTTPISPAALTPTSARQNQQSQHSSRQHGLRQQQQQPSPALPSPPPPPPLSDVPSAKERLQPPPLSKEPEPPILTLDDLFMKTKSTPRIYYLPLPEEQVVAKKKTKANNSRN